MRIDLDSLREALATGLPRQAHWEVLDHSVDYDFSPAHDALRPFDTASIEHNESAIDRLDLRVFGVASHAAGGGAVHEICLSSETGAVYGYDPEREPPLFLFNSSAHQFIQAFNYLDTSLQEGKPLPEGAETVLRNIDPAAYPESEWHLLLDYLKNG